MLVISSIGIIDELISKPIVYLFKKCVLTLLGSANQWIWWVFKQLNYYLTFNSQESEFEVLENLFSFDMRNPGGKMHMEVKMKMVNMHTECIKP